MHFTIKVLNRNINKKKKKINEKDCEKLLGGNHDCCITTKRICKLGSRLSDDTKRVISKATVSVFRMAKNELLNGKKIINF